jgi:hypothetical protein
MHKDGMVPQYEISTIMLIHLFTSDNKHAELKKLAEDCVKDPTLTNSVMSLLLKIFSIDSWPSQRAYGQFFSNMAVFIEAHQAAAKTLSEAIPPASHATTPSEDASNNPKRQKQAE